jgi:Tfp pilus assembly protein FimT
VNQKGRPSRGGFTLFELIIVMIIVFTLAAIVAPRFSDFFPSFQVRKSTEHLMAWARKARADAATTGLRQRLMVDAKARKFWIEYEARPVKEPGKFVLLAGAWGEEQMPDAVIVESVEGFDTSTTSQGAQYLEFLPDGTTKDAAIVLADDSGDTGTLKVEGATSKIYIQPVEAPK